MVVLLFLLFFFFFILVLLEIEFWKDKTIETHIRNELLEERNLFLQKSLQKLDKKHRKFCQKHLSCFPRKIIYLHR
jgi:Flp pilus assembly protein TadB